MKNIKRSTLILFAILACLCAAIPVSAKPSANTVKNAYEKYKSKKGIYRSLYVDIDKNGIVDMIYTRNGALGVCSYSSSQKKVVKVKEVAGTGKAPSKVYYNTSKHYFGGKYILNGETKKAAVPTTNSMEKPFLMLNLINRRIRSGIIKAFSFE